MFFTGSYFDVYAQARNRPSTRFTPLSIWVGVCVQIENEMNFLLGTIQKNDKVLDLDNSSQCKTKIMISPNCKGKNMSIKFSVIVFIIQLLIIVSVGVDLNQTKCDELLNRVQTRHRLRHNSLLWFADWLEQFKWKISVSGLRVIKNWVPFRISQKQILRISVNQHLIMLTIIERIDSHSINRKLRIYWTYTNYPHLFAYVLSS